MQVVKQWPLSQTAKTSPSHGEDMGSIPVGVTNFTSLCLLPFSKFPFHSRYVASAINILCAAFNLRVEETLRCFQRKPSVDGFFFVFKKPFQNIGRR